MNSLQAGGIFAVTIVRFACSAIASLPLLLVAAVPIWAETTYQRGYSSTTSCYRDAYREEYVPGTKDKPGYVRSWTEKIDVPCSSSSSPGTLTTSSSPAPGPDRIDDNSCLEGSILGGLLGAGAGAALSRGDGRWVGVPLGGVAGALVGCQVDGG